MHVVQALDESKNAMAMVTEPLFASVANTLGDLDNIAKVPKELKGMEMGLLEIKHGLLQVSESLDFLHNNARLIHRAISPETLFITSTGAWKLGGFGFALSVDQASGGSTSIQAFHYPEYDIEDSCLPLQPSLNYTAPELVRRKELRVGCSSDVFSFGCVVFHLIARKPLLDCHNNVKMYMNTLSYLSSEAFSMIPRELYGDLQRMLSMDEASRPSALDFTGSPFFRNDTRLRALRFLDHMLERDNIQKSEFLKALSDMWKDFDSRVLRYKVLPPLCAELRNMVMQPMILPMVLTIAESQDKNDFELSTLPALVPVLSSASGETLLLLVKHAELIINKATQEYLISHVLPLLVRAYDDTDPRVQEEVLRRTIPLARQLEMQLVKQAILPRVHGLALKTTVAAVRVNALRCLGDLVSMLDKDAVLIILQTLHRCTDVDRSAPTLMCTLGVANSIYKQYGIEFTSEHVLPLLFPLLTAQQLNVQQFAKYMLFVKDILRNIEEKRGVTVTESGTSDLRAPPPVTNGLHTEPPSRTTTVPTKSSPAWDEDWVSMTKGRTAATAATNTSNSVETYQPSKPSMPPAPSTSTSSPFTTSSPAQQTSCPPVDIEWPPSSSSASFGSQSVHNEEMKSFGGLSNGSFDDIDPFANWPPKPSNASSNIGSALNSSPNRGFSGSNSNTNHIGLSTAYQGSAISSIKNPSSLGLNTNTSSNTGKLNTGYGINTNSFNIPQNNPKRATDIGSIFSSANSGQPPRIAPPPTTAGGIAPPPTYAGGRGRGKNRASQSSQAKVTSEQPPLLDLL